MNEEPLKKWKHAFFAARLLQQPDGKLLYRYRATPCEYTSLKDALGVVLDTHSLNQLTTDGFHFPGLFVFYAAEWWRREYDGQWAWSPINQSLTDKECLWSAEERSRCIEKGLRFWRLEKTTAGGFRYLRAIALQGGLPLKRIAEARGRLSDVLRRSLALAKGGTFINPDAIRGWISSLSDRLPKSYCREEIYDLLTELVITTFKVVKEANLTESKKALAKLDTHVPGWRDRYPLPVEGKMAQGLIEQLILDASTAPKMRPFGNVSLSRRLHSLDGEIWTLHAGVTAPGELSTGSLKDWFEIDPEESLPRLFDLAISAGDTSFTLSAHRLAGHEKYAIDQHLKFIEGQDAAAHHQARLTCNDGRYWLADLRRGEPLENDLPWIFVDDRDGTLNFHHQGGGKLAESSAWLAIPAGWKIEPQAGTAEIKAYVDQPDRELYRVSGDILIKTNEDAIWRLRTGQADEEQVDYHWRGRRVWHDFIRPGLAFYGRPNLYCGDRCINSRHLDWKGQKEAKYFGPVLVTSREQGELLYRSRLLILPEQADIRFEPSGPTEGWVHFCSWGLADARIITPDIEPEIDSTADQLSIRMKAAGGLHVAPAYVELKLLWPDNPEPARLSMPFPAQGARLLDAEGSPLQQGVRLPVDGLAGTRLIAVGGLAHPTLRFGLRHTIEGRYGMEESVQIKPFSNAQRLDIRPMDHVDRIQRMLGSDELLDDWVEVSLHANHNEMFRFRVSRYLAFLERHVLEVRITDDTLKHLSPQQLQSLPVQALRLDTPADEPETLEAIESEGIPTGAWRFDQFKLGPGSWLIYPDKEAKRSLRLTLWHIDGAEPAQSPLTRAMTTQNCAPRQHQLDEVIQAMAADYMKPDWQDMECLAEHLGHLPLATLDLWRCFSHSTSAMAALALRLHRLPGDFTRRFAVELPFSWMGISMAEWRAAMHQCRLQAEAWNYPESAVGDHVNRRIESLTRWSPCLCNLLNIVKAEVLGEMLPELNMMKQPASDVIFSGGLFNGENCAMQNLMRMHAEEQWPDDLEINDWIDSRRKPDLATLFAPGNLGFKHSVVNLPIVIAYGCATDSLTPIIGNPALINAIRRYESFDPHWFETAYNHTIARCVARELVVLQR
ncbi:MAG: hypothetical protein GKR94_27555 [Gammaproteobacteria bacterium]|nr:hypothetical protein [Gammaproteobacteria bacterium]